MGGFVARLVKLWCLSNLATLVLCISILTIVLSLFVAAEYIVRLWENVNKFEYITKVLYKMEQGDDMKGDESRSMLCKFKSNLFSTTIGFGTFRFCSIELWSSMCRAALAPETCLLSKKWLWINLAFHRLERYLALK